LRGYLGAQGEKNVLKKRGEKMKTRGGGTEK